MLRKEEEKIRKKSDKTSENIVEISRVFSCHFFRLSSSFFFPENIQKNKNKEYNGLSPISSVEFTSFQEKFQTKIVQTESI